VERLEQQRVKGREGVVHAYRLCAARELPEPERQGVVHG
jgi:hypothetical protein